MVIDSRLKDRKLKDRKLKDRKLKDRELKDRKRCYVILVCISSTNICTLRYTPVFPIEIV
jgi:hypothetical protein